MKAKLFIGDLIRKVGMGVVLVLMIVAFAILKPDTFLSASNAKNIFSQITTNTILAVGMTFVILIGGIDLSVGAVMVLSAIAAASTVKSESLSLWLAVTLSVLAGMGVGALSGLLNGWVSENWKLPSFIVTMGMLNVARGTAKLVTDARTIYGLPQEVRDFGLGTVVGDVVPLIFVVALAMVIIGQFVLRWTVFGRMLLAVGNNEETVRLSGKNTKLIKTLAFTICGWCAGVAGVIFMARVGSVMPIAGEGAELDAIAAVIIGGTSLFGGKGSFVDTFIGACIIGILNNGLVLLGLRDFHRQVVTGIVIVLAVILDTYRARVAAGTTE
jgi:ribose transport system permease protein